MYVELVERKMSNRGTIVPLAQVGVQPAPYQRYMSMFPFDQGINEHVRIRATVKGYEGIRYCPVILIDIDHEDLDVAKVSSQQLIDQLYDRYRLAPEHLLLYFSGSKGFHIGISDRLIGGIEGSASTPDRVEAFVTSIGSSIEGLDRRVYDENRLFRIVNSINEKSGKYKIPLHIEELRLSGKAISELASNPRPQFSRAVPISSLKANLALSSVWLDTDRENTELTSSGSSSRLFTIPEKGNRNNLLFKQACALFDRSDLSMHEVVEILHAFNTAADPPLSGQELDSIVRSAAQRTNHKETSLELKSIGEWLPAWYDSLREDQNKISLAIPDFDRELRSKVRGKLCVLIGKGGTKKSLYAQNIAYRNEQARTIYSSMEMGSVGIVGRGIDMASDIEGVTENAAVFLEDQDRINPGAARKILEEHQFSQLYGDKLLITQNTGLTTDDYYKLIGEAESRYGTVDILIPDGLSMMGGKGTETELVNQHTKELKQLAIEKNVFVVLIVHVTKEGTKTTRDLAKQARGSEKIIDNCDFYISMSLVERPSITDEESYYEEYGHMRLVNKRGTGNVVDVVYEFDKKRLLMVQSEKQLRDL